jgi:hypothetical protein
MKPFGKKQIVNTILNAILTIILLITAKYIYSAIKNKLETFVGTERKKDKIIQQCRNARDGVSGCRDCCQGVSKCVDVCMSS